MATSLVNLFRIRPVGFLSKKAERVKVRLFNADLCSSLFERWMAR